MLCNYLGGVSWSIAWVLNFLTACLASIHKKYLEGVNWNCSSNLKKSEAVTRPSGTPDNAWLVVLITFLQRVVAVEGLKSSLREQLQPWLLSSCSTRIPNPPELALPTISLLTFLCCFCWEDRFHSWRQSLLIRVPDCLLKNIYPSLDGASMDNFCEMPSRTQAIS